MKKYLLSLFTILSFAGYAHFQRQADSSLQFTENSLTQVEGGMQPGKLIVVTEFTQSTSTAQVPQRITQPVVVLGGTVPKPAPVPIVAPAVVGKFKDGSYDGDIADVYYGLVQVRAIIKNGKLVDVVWLSYPNDNSTSAGKSARARPILTQEAIVAQDAQVDRVSGASATSGGFVDSLASALAQAKA